MHDKPEKLPDLKVLKKLLKDKNNLVWYSRLPHFKGSDESINYLKKKIKKFKKQKNKRDKLQNRDNLTIL
jgi:hypothetical protein